MKIKQLVSTASFCISALMGTQSAYANSTDGAWGPVMDWGLIPLHAIVLPDGKVFSFGTDERGIQGGNFIYNIFDPITGQNKVLPNTTGSNIFCSNMAIDPGTGDVLVAGGDNYRVGGAQWSGRKDAVKFDYKTQGLRWAETGNMNYARWYGTMLTLNNGEILSIGGRNASRQGSKIPEIYNAKTGYRTLPGAAIDDLAYGQGGLRGTYYYMYAWQASDNDVWVIEAESEGATSDIYRLDVTGQGSVTKVGKIPFKTRNLSPGIMYDVDKVLMTDVDGWIWAGDLSKPTPTWEKRIQIMDEDAPTRAVARTNGTFFPMPDGKVAILGGSASIGLLADSVAYGQSTILIYDPEANTYELTAKEEKMRLYHSVGLMLPDGRVFAGGGGAPGPYEHLNAEVFSPAYLYNKDGSLAARPKIVAAPKNIEAGTAVEINVDDASKVKRITMMKAGSATHGRTSDARVFKMDYTVVNNTTIRVNTPQANILSPGLWMLSTVTSEGVPSVSKIMGVNMATLAEVPGLDSEQKTIVYNNQTNDLVGAFSITVDARFDDMTRSNQHIFDFGNGAASDNILLAQRADSRDMRFAIYEGNVKHEIVAQNAIVEDEIATWTASVDRNGLMQLFKNGTLLAEGQGEVPGEVARANRLVGQSNTNGYDQLYGLVRNLAIDGGDGNGGEHENHMPMIDEDLSKLAGSVTEDASLPADSTSPYRAAGEIRYFDMDETDVHTASVEAASDDYVGQFTIGKATTTDTTTHGTVSWQFSVPHAAIAQLAAGEVLTQTYKVTIADDHGAAHGANVVVTINGATADVPVVIEPLTTAAVDAGKALTLTASATGGKAPLQYKWNFGDNTPETAYSATNTATHQYTAPGSYTVTLTVKDATGQEKTATTTQTVLTVATALQPNRSSTIAFDAAGKRLWNVNPDNDTVSVFDVTTNAKVAEIPVGDHPRSVAVSDAGDVWVTNQAAGTVTIIDGASLAVKRTLSVTKSSAPFGVVFHPSKPEAFITLEASGELLRLNTNTFSLKRLALGGVPRHLSITGDGEKIYVSRFITAPVTGESTAAPNPSDNEGGEVTVVDSEAMEVLSTIHLVADRGGDTEVSASGIPNYLGAPVISPDGLSAWVPSKEDNIFRGELRDNANLDFEHTVRAVSSQLDLSNDAEVPSKRIDFDDSSIASAGVYDPTGRYLFITLETSRQVAVVDGKEGVELFRFDTGLAPQGVTISNDGLTLYVHNFMGRNIGVYDLTQLIKEDDTQVKLVTILDAVANEQLSAQVLKGKQLFYDAADDRLARENYMSCASCHNDGGQDGRVWDLTGFGEGLRNTIALNGRAGMAHGFLHWSGNFDEVQDFERQIRQLAGGTGLMTDAEFNEGTRNASLGDKKAGVSADLDALAAYVQSLTTFAPSPKRQYGKLTAQATAGKQVFISQNCAACHSGDRFTKSSDIDGLDNVGTIKGSSGNRLGEPLTGLDVPTLRDVWQTAPYLHDGSALTLDAAVKAHTNLTISQAEIDQVVAYISQIGNAEAGGVASGNNAEPTVTLNPAQGQDGNTSGSIEAVANDSDGTIQRVEFYVDTQLLATLTEAPYVFSWQNIPAGSYPLTAKAYDNAGAIATSNSVTVVVGADGGGNSGNNTPPTVSLNAPVATTGNVSGSIEAVAADADGNVTKVEFYNGTQLIRTVNSSPYVLTWSDVPNGLYSITAKAYDNASAAATSSAVQIKVDSTAATNPDNAAPTVTLKGPLDASQGNVNGRVEANATDADGRIIKVEFYYDGNLIETDTSAPYEMKWNNIPNGSYALTAKAYDNDNAVAISETVVVEVTGN